LYPKVFRLREPREGL
jgi:hypothetical protein